MIDREKMIKENERIDDLQLNGYSIIQDPQGFCFGIDAVLLANFAKIKKDEEVLDLGTGTGIIPILLHAKSEGKRFVGLEIQDIYAKRARRSVLLNGCEDKIEIVQGDIKEAADCFGSVSFDVITTNPPYMKGQQGLKNSNEEKTIARHEILCDLDDILRESAKILKPKGRFYMVHRPNRLVEIFTKMHFYKIEPKRMQLVYPTTKKEPKLVLIEGLRGGGQELIVEPPLIQENE